MGFHLLFNPLFFSTDFHENHIPRLDRRSFSISFWISCFCLYFFFFGISFRIFNLIAKLTNAFIANSTFRVIFCLLEKYKCFKQSTNNRQARCVWLKFNVWTGYSDTVRWGLLYRQTNSLSFSKRAKQSFETAKQAPEENIQLFAMDVGEGGGQAQELSATHITVNTENY